MWTRAIAIASAVALVVTPRTQAAPLTIVDDRPGTFIDISQTGTSLALSDDGSQSFTTSISNGVFPAGRIVVGNNGGVAFDPIDDALDPLNAAIPSLAAFGGDQALLAFWDDFDDKQGDVYYEEIADDRLIVQWHMRGLGATGDTATFQMQVFDGVPALRGGPPIYAQFIYQDIEQTRPNGGESATIGYQDGASGSFNDVQWSFDTAGAVSDGTVLSLVPEPASGAVLAAGAALVVRRRRSSLRF